MFTLAPLRSVISGRPRRPDASAFLSTYRYSNRISCPHAPGHREAARNSRVLFTTSEARKRGFTLLEVLIALALISVLAALVYPVVLQQIERVQARRVLEDLGSLRTATRLFSTNLRGSCAGDIEDLANSIDGTDQQANDTFYSQTLQGLWNGPYLTTEISSSATGDVLMTGLGGRIQNDLVLFDLAESRVPPEPADADHIAAVILGWTGGKFEIMNELIDGEEEFPEFEGRLHFDQLPSLSPSVSLGTTYFLLMPCSSN